MGISGVLDIAIGLIFTYLVLSLIGTIINEILATSLSLRGRQLNLALTMLLDDLDVRRAFYNNGLIASSQTASRGGNDDAVTAWKIMKPGFPSWVIFLLTAPVRLARWIWSRGPRASNGSRPQANVAGAAGVIGAAGVGATATGQPRDEEHPSYFDSRIFAMALLDSLDSTNAAGQKEFPAFKTIKDSVEKMNDSNIRDVLLANIATADNDLQRLRDNVAHWYDATMDRLSGDYKRETKKISLAIGFLIAAVLNADSIAISRVLWADPTLRGQLVEAAQKMVDAGEISPTCGQPPAAPAAGKPPVVPAADKAAADPAIAKLDCLLQNLRDQDAKLRPLPLGWRTSEFSSWFKGFGIVEGIFYGFGFLLLKILGIAWTGLALSLGAPFWFDILQKFMNIRGAGAKPQDSRTSKPA